MEIEADGTKVEKNKEVPLKPGSKLVFGGDNVFEVSWKVDVELASGRRSHPLDSYGLHQKDSTPWTAMDAIWLRVCSQVMLEAFEHCVCPKLLFL